MLASLLFLGLLAHNNLISLLPLTGFLLLGYISIGLLERGYSKSLVWIILAIVFAYVWLKKYTLLPQGVFLNYPYFTLGLSYIFFRVLQIVIDTGDGDRKAHMTPGAYLLYTLNFTTLVSGPIQRYDEFARDQFPQQPISLGPGAVGLQLVRIVRGFFKVSVLSVVLRSIQEDALAQMHQSYPLSLRFLAAFRLAVVYPFFLYCNFSGYIDIVIALARLMRVRLPENFDRPFSSSSFLDFWNRWHITLSTWLKTYVYNPLLITLTRRIPLPSMQPLLGVFCFFVTFFLVGIWHGRTSEFAMFGVLQGGGVAINKLWQLRLIRVMGTKGYKAMAKNPIYNSLARGLTFSWFAFTLFWFWANWTQIGAVFAALTAVQWLGVWLTVLLFSTVILEIWEQLRAGLLSIKTSEGEPLLANRYVHVVYATALGVVTFAVTALLNQPPPGIVYKTF